MKRIYTADLAALLNVSLRTLSRLSSRGSCRLRQGAPSVAGITGWLAIPRSNASLPTSVVRGGLLMAFVDFDTTHLKEDPACSGAVSAAGAPADRDEWVRLCLALGCWASLCGEDGLAAIEAWPTRHGRGENRHRQQYRSFLKGDLDTFAAQAFLNSPASNGQRSRFCPVRRRSR